MSNATNQPDDDDVRVVEDPAGGFFELQVKGESAGLMIYERFGPRLVLTHTAIAPAFQGRRLSWRMMSDTLDTIRSRGETITNTCPVLDRFLKSNPQYADLLDIRHPGTWPERLPTG